MSPCTAGAASGTTEADGADQRDCEFIAHIRATASTAAAAAAAAAAEVARAVQHGSLICLAVTHH